MTSHRQSLASLIRADEVQYASSPRSALTRIVSATRSTSCPSSTEATSLRFTPFFHGSDWSRTASCATAKTASHSNVCSRQDTFLNVFCIQIDNWVAFHGCRVKSHTFPTEIHTFTKHVPSLMFRTVKRALCDGLHGNFPTNSTEEKVMLILGQLLASVSAHHTE